jgi:ectoine hydroxylase-related dioxygenase (phytanoyl-CoA dioxygenase family)
MSSYRVDPLLIPMLQPVQRNSSMAKIPVLPNSAAPTEVADKLSRVGCVVVTGVTGAETREAIARELAPYLETADAGQSLNKKYAEQGGDGSFYPGNTKRVAAMVAKSPSYHSLVTHPLTLGVCDAILKPNCASYQVHATAALVVGPGATVQVLHREEDSFKFFPLPRPNLVVASMWAISDFTEANGGTRLVPGSHRWPADRVARDDEVCAAEMPAGSVLFWMGGTLHGAGANRSDQWRFGTFLSFSLGWLRQEENHYINVPPELAYKIPKQVRDLIGYKMHAALGYTDVRPKNKDAAPRL